jgi:hypothetical protein
VQEDAETLEALLAEKEGGEREAEEVRRQMEEDADEEIEGLKNGCGHRLLSPVATCMHACMQISPAGLCMRATCCPHRFALACKPLGNRKSFPHTSITCLAPHACM